MRAQPSTRTYVRVGEFNTTCTDCGGRCERWEVVNTDGIGDVWEIWCYCRACDVETFHPYEVSAVGHLLAQLAENLSGGTLPALVFAPP